MKIVFMSERIFLICRRERKAVFIPKKMPEKGLIHLFIPKQATGRTNCLLTGRNLVQNHTCVGGISR